MHESLAAAAPPSQRRPPWLPPDPGRAAAERRAALLGQAVADLAEREERVLGTDADEMREAAVFARAMGTDPAAAVGTVVREALAELAAREDDLARLGRDLAEVGRTMGGITKQSAAAKYRVLAAVRARADE
ncbi:hypothetical protein ACWEO1_16860 [Kitasatospora cineracea]